MTITWASDGDLSDPKSHQEFYAGQAFKDIDPTTGEVIEGRYSESVKPSIATAENSIGETVTLKGKTRTLNLTLYFGKTTKRDTFRVSYDGHDLYRRAFTLTPLPGHGDIRGRVLRDAYKTTGPNFYYPPDGVIDLYQEDDVAWAGVRVWLDKDHDGVWDKKSEPSRLTDETGRYAFKNIATALYDVRVGTPASSACLGASVQQVGLVNKASVTNINFLFQGTSTIAGRIYVDANKDGKPSRGEATPNGAFVFFDADNDGALDPDEARATTTKGYFQLTNVFAAKGTVRYLGVPLPDYAVVFPGAVRQRVDETSSIDVGAIGI